MKKKKGTARVREIVSIFLKYGIKDGVKITNPAQIRMALEELGPTFIKIGQILSTRPDIVPESFVEEFQKLHDKVKPESFEDIKQILDRDLGRPVEEVFLSFQKQPIASASMADVHLAVLRTGEKVVVKVQRPKAKETMLSDIAILKRLATFLKLTPQGNVLNPVEIVDELLHVVTKELNFLNEAENIKKFRENNKDVKYITCPQVYQDYTKENILVMSYIEGIKVDKLDYLNEEGYDLEDLAVKLTGNYLKQIFEDGFFHGDPHPGNILISGRKIAFIDFGMMGTLSKTNREKFNQFLYGIATKSVDTMTQAIMRIGIRKGNLDYRRIYSDVEEIFNSYIDVSLHEINLPQLMDEIIKACRKNNIAMPRDITMLMKGLMTIEGVIAKTAPDVNIMDVAVPYVKSRMLKKRDYKQDIIEQFENLYILSKYGLKIPIKLMELMNSAVAGKLKMQMEHINMDRSIVELHKMINRLVFGIIVSSLIIGSSLVIKADVGPRAFNLSLIGFAGYIGAAVIGIWLLVSILRSGRM